MKGYLRLIEPVADLLVTLRVSPNVLTSVGTLCTVSGGFAFATGHIRTAGWIIGLTAIFDVLDGTIARRTGKATVFGAFYDSTLDRVSDGALLGGIAWFYATNAAWASRPMRLTRSLEERLVNLYRQTKVVGGLFRSLGQEADAVGSAYALDRKKGDILSPLIRNLGSMLVQGAMPNEIIKQYMAKGDSPTRGRELNIHYGDLVRGFIGQISHLGDMVPVMAGVTLSFKMRGEDRVGLVYVGDGATSTGAFHEGINFAAVQRCPLVVIVENNGYAYSTPLSKQTAAKQLVDKAIGYGVVGEQADGNDVIATYEVTRRAVDRARAGEGVTLIELMSRVR